jgi:hypothetical protein
MQRLANAWKQAAQKCAGQHAQPIGCAASMRYNRASFIHFIDLHKGKIN